MDLVAAFQSGDLLAPHAKGLYSEPCLTLASFSLLFTSCMDHAPAFSMGAEGNMSLLPSWILSFPPFSVLLAFSLSASFLPLGPRAPQGVLKLIKAVCPAVAGRC